MKKFYQADFYKVIMFFMQRADEQLYKARCPIVKDQHLATLNSLRSLNTKVNNTQPLFYEEYVTLFELMHEYATLFSRS